MLTQPMTGGITPMSPADPVQASISQKDLVTKLREFAQNPHHQHALISNMECLSTLCEVLATAIDSETCLIAIQTLQFLANNPNYRSVLKEVPKLIQRVTLLTKSKHSRINLLASKLLETINSNLIDRKSQTYEPRPLYSIHLKIVNLKTIKDRNDISKVAIAVKGVISVSANITTHHATFYCTKDDLKNKLIHALRTKGFQIQDESNEHKGSVYLDDGMSQQSKDKEQLSDFDVSPTASPITQESSQGATYIEHRDLYANQSAITRYQPDPSIKTLSQRLEEERLENESQKQEEQKTQSLLSTVLSYIW